MPSNPRQKRKLRAGHTKRQSKKQARKKQQHKRESKVQVVNPLIAKQWDKKKTLNENFRALGLILDPNNDVAGDKSRWVIECHMSCLGGVYSFSIFDSCKAKLMLSAFTNANL
eukprot:TRINITY_DN9049_c0_g2_i5.p1 TRINITY_DN9049_c0_g2~~TRINITY_DN9049_c0_g2_i5.p1  ORF type:complete len:113 (+),score=5.73 TRINITY_DN9049_c0_g2_i5:51-389(+)